MTTISANNYATLYSTQQDAFHVESLRETISTNLEMCVFKRGNDYILTGLHDTIDAAVAFNDRLRAMQQSKRLNHSAHAKV